MKIYTMYKLLSFPEKSYTIHIHPNRSNRHRASFSYVNLCFMNEDSGNVFLHRSKFPLSMNTSSHLTFYGPDINIDKVLISTFDAYNNGDIGELEIKDVGRFVSVPGEKNVYQKIPEFSQSKYDDNMKLYSRLKDSCITYAAISTTIGVGMLTTRGNYEEALMFGLGSAFGALYQVLLQYDVDRIGDGQGKTRFVLPLRMSLIIALIYTVDNISVMDPHIFMLSVLGFMTNKFGVVMGHISQDK